MIPETLPKKNVLLVSGYFLIRLKTICLMIILSTMSRKSVVASRIMS